MKLQESLFKLYSVYYAIVNYIFSGLAPLHGCLSEISEYMLDLSQDYGSDLITGIYFASWLHFPYTICKYQPLAICWYTMACVEHTYLSNNCIN